MFFRKFYGQFVTSGAQVLLLVAGIQFSSRGPWIVCLSLMAVLSLFAWSSTWRRRRAITDTPTSRIASAAQGYVELSGTGRPLDDPLLSHLTGLPCLWYRWEVSKSGEEHSVDRGESELPFLIDDGSGRCVVDVEGAEILTRHKKTWTRGAYSYTEWKLSIGDPIYALGEFKTLGGGSVELNARRDQNELLTEWKKDRTTLIERFDLNRDGEFSEKEWALARQAARREVSKIHREARNEPGVHTLVQPRDGRQYLIANVDPGRIARRYLGWSIFHVAVFLAALGALGQQTLWISLRDRLNENRQAHERLDEVKVLQRFDRDGDGELDDAEVQQMIETLREEHKTHREKRGQSGAHPRRAPA